MAYQVLARKYRPQRFDDVIGQQAVTKTLRNALTQERLAQAFVFAGPRGVGKTTTARILARALNCAAGPTPDPCGTCDACTEIAEGRDIDVLEIDAATHTQVDNIREVIIAGLAMAPVRNRYKIYIIDEVHQLSSHSFNALLKSIEEPPPHVVFMMATTQIEKIPETILSRSQVYELRTIGRRQIAEQLRTIAAAESIAVDDAALGLVARAAAGSMRDAESAFDQVIAFAGETIGVDDVSTVLGLIGRDPVLDAVTAVADEDAAAVFDLAGRFVEAGYDLRLVCRELSRAIRDLLVLAIDPARADDPEIAGEGERDRLAALAQRFSREDLLRAFDAIARAEAEIKSAAQPRYHLEMALLRWMHLRKLAPLSELLAGRGSSVSAGAGAVAAAGRPRGSSVPRAASPAASRSAASAPRSDSPAAPRGAAPAARTVSPAAPRPAASAADRPTRDDSPPHPAESASARASAPDRSSAASPRPPAPAGSGDAGARDALLAEIKQSNRFFHGTVVAQAQRIEIVGERLVFTFPPGRRTLAGQLRSKREWIEALAAKVVGRRLTVEAVEEKAAAGAQGAGKQRSTAAGAGASGGGGGVAAPAGTGAAAGGGSATLLEGLRAAGAGASGGSVAAAPGGPVAAGAGTGGGATAPDGPVAARARVGDGRATAPDDAGTAGPGVGVSGGTVSDGATDTDGPGRAGAGGSPVAQGPGAAGGSQAADGSQAPGSSAAPDGRAPSGSAAAPGGPAAPDGAESAGGSTAPGNQETAADSAAPDAEEEALRERALGDSVVKATLDLFPAEITSVEKI